MLCNIIIQNERKHCLKINIFSLFSAAGDKTRSNEKNKVIDHHQMAGQSNHSLFVMQHSIFKSDAALDRK